MLMYKDMEPLTEEEKKTVEENIGIVWHYVNKWKAIFNHRDISDDLFQCGIMGLMRAVKTWDPEKSTLPTYCKHWIMRSIESFVIGDNTIKPSEGKAIRVRRILNKLSKNPELTCASPEIRKMYNNVSPEYVEKLINSEVYVSVASFNKPSWDSGAGGISGIAFGKAKTIPSDEPTPSDKYELAEDLHLMHYYIDKMPNVVGTHLTKTSNNIKKLVLKGYFFDEKTLDEVGKDNNITRERVRQIRNEAIEDLRRIMK